MTVRLSSCKVLKKNCDDFKNLCDKHPQEAFEEIDKAIPAYLLTTTNGVKLFYKTSSDISCDSFSFDEDREVTVHEKCCSDDVADPICSLDAKLIYDIIGKTPTAKQAAKKYGITRGVDTIVLKGSDNKVKWPALKNDFFSVLYPKCYTVKGGFKDDPSDTCPIVDFSADDKCETNSSPYYDSKSGFSIEFKYKTEFHKGIDEGAGNLLFTQELIVNDNPAALFVNILDGFDGVTRQHHTDLRWRIDISCENRVYSVTWHTTGKGVNELLKKKTYNIPSDVSKTIGTFTCKKKLPKNFPE